MSSTYTHILYPPLLLLCTNLPDNGAGVLIEREEVHPHRLVNAERKVVGLVLAPVDEGAEGKGTRCSDLLGGERGEEGSQWDKRGGGACNTQQENKDTFLRGAENEAHSCTAACTQCTTITTVSAQTHCQLPGMGRDAMNKCCTIVIATGTDNLLTSGTSSQSSL